MLSVRGSPRSAHITIERLVTACSSRAWRVFLMADCINQICFYRLWACYIDFLRPPQRSILIYTMASSPIPFPVPMNCAFILCWAFILFHCSHVIHTLPVVTFQESLLWDPITANPREWLHLNEIYVKSIVLTMRVPDHTFDGIILYLVCNISFGIAAFNTYLHRLSVSQHLRIFI